MREIKGKWETMIGCYLKRINIICGGCVIKKKGEREK